MQQQIVRVFYHSLFQPNVRNGWFTNEGFIPIVSKTPGSIAYYAIDAGDGVVASISVFEDQVGAEESNRLATDWVKTAASLLPNAPKLQPAKSEAIVLPSRHRQFTI